MANYYVVVFLVRQGPLGMVRAWCTLRPCVLVPWYTLAAYTLSMSIMATPCVWYVVGMKLVMSYAIKTRSTPTPWETEIQTMVWVFPSQKLRPWSEFLLSPINAESGVVWVWSEFGLDHGLSFVPRSQKPWGRGRPVGADYVKFPQAPFACAPFGECRKKNL